MRCITSSANEVLPSALCKLDWDSKHPGGLAKDFAVYWKAISKEDQKVRLQDVTVYALLLKLLSRRHGNELSGAYVAIYTAATDRVAREGDGESGVPIRAEGTRGLPEL